MASKIIRSVVCMVSSGAVTLPASVGRRTLIQQRNSARWLSITPCVTAIQRSPTDRAGREAANRKARIELALAYRAVVHYGLNEGIDNHLTLRTPGLNTDGDVMLVIPHGLPWEQVTASSLIGVDFVTGEKVEGGEGEALEAGIHLHSPVHQARYDKDGTIAVMHTHQPYTLALACLDEPEPFDVTMCQNSMRFAGKIAFDFDYQTVAMEMNEGERLAGKIGEKDVLLIGQHGVLTLGRRVCDAFDTLYYVERAAMAQVLARSMGAKTLSAPPAVVNAIPNLPIIPRNAERHFESLHKLLVERTPCYMD